MAELQTVPTNLAAEDPAAEYPTTEVPTTEDPTTEDTTEESTPQKPATKIFVDNQGAIALAHNPKFHARTKHIAIQEHYLRETVTIGEIELEYVHTGDMIADCLTKNLSRAKAKRFWAKMGLH